MIILPAIDIQGGQCVRLYQGDFERVTIYDADPAQAAQRWQAAGARWLHVVDLDGAVAGHPVNLETVARVHAATSLHIEMGGGIRELKHIEQVLDLGVERVILGTIALTDRALLEEALARWGEQIAVGLDARNGLIAISGWRETTRVQAIDLATELHALGVQRFIYTDIARDGALQGPNLNALREMQQRPGQPGAPPALIASGGISSLEDLRLIAALGIEGAIVGKALYTGDVDLGEAVRALQAVEER